MSWLLLDERITFLLLLPLHSLSSLPRNFHLSQPQNQSRLQIPLPFPLTNSSSPSLPNMLAGNGLILTSWLCFLETIHTSGPKMSHWAFWGPLVTTASEAQLMLEIPIALFEVSRQERGRHRSSGKPPKIIPLPLFVVPKWSTTAISRPKCKFSPRKNRQLVKQTPIHASTPRPPNSLIPLPSSDLRCPQGIGMHKEEVGEECGMALPGLLIPASRVVLLLTEKDRNAASEKHIPTSAVQLSSPDQPHVAESCTATSYPNRKVDQMMMILVGRKLAAHHIELPPAVEADKGPSNPHICGSLHRFRYSLRGKLSRKLRWSEVAKVPD